MLFKSKITPIVLGLVFILDAWLYAGVVNGQAPATSAPELYFLDVGQGDSELIQFPNGVQMVIDGGPPNGELLSSLAAILPPQDRYIDLVLMTHPQLDHMGGFVELVRQYKIGAFIGTGRAAPLAAYQELAKLLQQKNIPYVEVKEGDTIAYQDSYFKILAPNASELKSKELNDTCIVGLLETPYFKALYTGDTGFKIEERITRQYDINADILKVGHHGSRFSSGSAFLKEVSPALSVIEVGAKNTYGHPTPAALGRLEANASEIFRTDKQGIIKVTYENGGLQVSHLE